MCKSKSSNDDDTGNKRRKVQNAESSTVAISNPAETS
jgi:hypothetical protein